MCRHLAAVGGPSFDGLTVADLLFDAPHALVDQARTPKHQPVGRINPDGWGVAWYPPASERDTPEHYRTVTSIWDDGGYVAAARAIECRTVIAAARLASPGLVLASESNAPFVDGPWAFSLNGFVDDFRAAIGDELRAGVSPGRRSALESDTDSEVLFALTLDRIGAGHEPAAALAGVMHFVTGITTGRINLLLTDGDAVYATRWGNSLFTRGPVVASEPLDDAPDWREVPDHSLVVVTPNRSEVTAL